MTSDSLNKSERLLLYAISDVVTAWTFTRNKGWTRHVLIQVAVVGTIKMNAGIGLSERIHLNLQPAAV